MAYLSHSIVFSTAFPWRTALGEGKATAVLQQPARAARVWLQVVSFFKWKLKPNI